MRDERKIGDGWNELPTIPDAASMADWNNPIAQRLAFNQWVKDFNAALITRARAAYAQGGQEMSDAKSVNDAHTDVPELLAEVTRLRAEIETMKDAR